MVGVLGAGRADRADPALLQHPLDQQHGRPVAPVVGGEHAEALGIAELEEVLHPVHRLRERLLHHQVRASGRGQVGQGHVRIGRRADDRPVHALQRRLHRRRHRREGKISGRLLPLRRRRVVAGQRYVADGAEVAKVTTTDATQSDDRELHGRPPQACAPTPGRGAVADSACVAAVPLDLVLADPLEVAQDHQLTQAIELDRVELLADDRGHPGGVSQIEQEGFEVAVRTAPGSAACWCSTTRSPDTG